MPALKIRLGSELVCLCLLMIQASNSLFSGPLGGFLSGVVRERSGTLMPDVEVRIQNESSGVQQKVSCDENGKFVSTELLPGSYRVTLRRRGFRTASYAGLTVQAGQTRFGDFTIEIVPLQQEITVESSRDSTDPAANGVAVSRNSRESALPANGRDLHAYYVLVPGATLTPASSSDGGQFTVNGQRPNTNTIRVDGINANTGLGVSGLPGTYPGSSLPAMTAIGSTQSIASREEIERTELRSSNFSPDSGERPGAQISVETRSGSNDFHGSAFGLLRPRALNSEDWFAQKYQVPLEASSLSGNGVSLGGALIPNRTFFFVAFENEHVEDTAMQLTAVPSLLARAEANNGIALLLNAFPAPIGPSLGGGTAVGNTPLQQYASVQNYGARLDQIVGDRGRIFARYSNVPSRSVTQQLSDINARLSSISATAGLTAKWLGAVHDLRVNFSRATDTSSWAARSANEQAAFNSLPGQPAGSQTALPNGNLLATNFYGGIAALSISGVGQLVSGTAERTYQNQWEGAYTFSKQWGRHEFRFGGDYLRLLPSTLAGRDGTTSAVSAGVESLLAGVPLGLTISDGKPIIYVERISIGSAFLQDSFHVNDRLSLMYGLRWEVTPPINTTVAETYLNSIATWTGPGAPADGSGFGARLSRSTWPMSYTQLAPRFGLAYRLRRPALVFRVGGGAFYETALGSLIDPVNLSPLNTWEFVPRAGATSPPAAAYTNVISTPLSLPRIWEWRASAERAIGDRSTLSLAYAGSLGSRLLRLQGVVDQSSKLLQETDFTNYGASQYQALQAQFRGDLISNLSALISYTWGHSIDNGSQASAVYLAQPGHPASLDRASSDFDIRHNLSASLSYRVAAHFGGSWQNWLKSWTLSSSVEARTGFPFNVTTVDRSIGLGFANTGRPNLLSGQPIWIQNNFLPTGKELNPNAFQAPANGVNGSLGRNILTGPGLFQIDASLRRQFRLFGGSSLETSVSAFNLLNRAGFSNPVGYLGSTLFGQPTSMQSLMIGSGNPTNGLAPLFQSGGPRTVEISLKISF